MSSRVIWGMRLLMIFIFTLFFMFFISSILVAAFGEFDAAAELFEIEITQENPEPLPLWRIALSTVLVLILLYGLLSVFLAVNKMLGLAKLGQMASIQSGKALRNLGRGMVIIWFSTVLVEGAVPWILFSGVTDNLEVDIPVIGLETIMAVCGFALYVVARLADEAHLLKEEMAGVV